MKYRKQPDPDPVRRAPAARNVRTPSITRLEVEPDARRLVPHAECRRTDVGAHGRGQDRGCEVKPPTDRYRLRTVHVSIACEPAGPAVDHAAEAARVARAILRDLDPDQEHMIVIALNARNKINGFRVIATGTLTSTILHPPEVFRAAIMLGAANIILVHNHPSGDPNPSEEDHDVTARMIVCGKLLGIPVLDHVIVAGDVVKLATGSKDHFLVEIDLIGADRWSGP